jgi:hypothetical protein
MATIEQTLGLAPLTATDMYATPMNAFWSPVPTKSQTPHSNPLASLFGQFIAAWTNPSGAATGQLFSALATELQTALSLPHPHG